MMTKTNFGEKYSLFTLENKNGMRVSVTDLGATVQSIVVPDKNGVFADVVLGYDTPEEYLQHDAFLGATVGRYANRIGGAKFTLNGTEYKIKANEGKNTLHGGDGFDKRQFSTVVQSGDQLILGLVDPDGANGFPGKLVLTVGFRLTDDNELEISYEAGCDRDTVVNFTNHSYFNLRGSGNVLDHELKINADRYTPADAESIPTGELAPVAGTDFDFRTMRRIEKDFYDHNFVLNGNDCAEVYEPESGRTMSVRTDMPGVQFYAAAWLGDRTGKGGAQYSKNSALCLETQFFPDTPNKPDFPSCVLKAGEVFRSMTVYKFCVK